jgi:hypothetical protein
MKNILTFESFNLKHNEEIDWKKIGKAATTAALGASLALGSPSKGMALDTKQQTEFKAPTELEWSEVIEMPGKGAQEIEMHITQTLMELRKNPQTRNTGIRSIQMVPGYGRLTAEVILNVSPTGVSGDTYCQVEFIVKPGKYKMIIRETKLVSSGSGNISSRVKPMLGPAAADAAKRAIGNRMGPAGQILGNVVGSTVHDITTRQTANAAQKRDKSERLKDEDYADWAKQLEVTTSKLFSYFSGRAGRLDDENF